MDILFYVVVVLLLSANLYFVTRKDDSDEKEEVYTHTRVIMHLYIYTYITTKQCEIENQHVT